MRNSNDTIGNRTRDLPACSAVPPPSTPPGAPGNRHRTVFSDTFVPVYTASHRTVSQYSLTYNRTPHLFSVVNLYTFSLLGNDVIDTIVISIIVQAQDVVRDFQRFKCPLLCSAVLFHLFKRFRIQQYLIFSTTLYFQLLVPIFVRFLRINPLKTKRRLLYLKTQFVSRSKHFSSRL